MSIILYIFSFLLLLVLFSLIIVKKSKYSKQNFPPSPPKLPFIGNLHQLRGLFHRSLHSLSKKHGPVILLRLGVLRMVVISSSEAAEEVLKTHDLECCTRPVTLASTVFSRNGNDVGFGEYGEAWRELRKLAVREFFSVTKVRSFRYVREEESDLMVKQLRESALKQSPVDLSKTLFCLTASIVFRTAFGQSFLENKHIDKERIEELMLEAHSNMTFNLTDMFPTAGLGWFMDFVSGQRKRLHDVFTEVDTFLNHIIDDHQSKNFTQDRPDFIDYLLEMIPKQERSESFKLTIDHLKGIIQNIYLAGVDTSAITMIWAMTELVRNPRVMKKAQDEIRTCIKIKQNERIDEEDVDKLHYLKLVIKETLRLHPAAPLLLPRETMSQIKIQGYNIPPKTFLVVNTWSIGRDPKHWEDPEEFIPERFIDSPVDYKGQSFEMLPFGSGRRMCPGMASAIATIELGLLNLLYYFDWGLPEEGKYMDMEEDGNITVVKKVPLKLLPILHH
ncbi:Cytochrome P450 71B4 [Raphanus sativus]|nr:Cytochrome P450 71B4 [Raphanus sativus]